MGQLLIILAAVVIYAALMYVAIRWGWRPVAWCYDRAWGIVFRVQSWRHYRRRPDHEDL